MPHYRCENHGCDETATLRLIVQDAEGCPTFLCAKHWNELRLQVPECAHKYGSIKVLGPEHSDREYSDRSAIPDSRGPGTKTGERNGR